MVCRCMGTVRAKRPPWIYFIFIRRASPVSRGDPSIHYRFAVVLPQVVLVRAHASDIYFYNVIKGRVQLQTELPRKSMIALVKEEIVK